MTKEAIRQYSEVEKVNLLDASDEDLQSFWTICDMVHRDLTKSIEEKAGFPEYLTAEELERFTKGKSGCPKDLVIKHASVMLKKIEIEQELKKRSLF